VREHYFAVIDGKRECVFCSAEEGSEYSCVSRQQIGRQVAFLIGKLERIRSSASTVNCAPGAVGIIKIVEERPDWVDPIETL
jgi:hypothetical protein